MTRHDPSAQGAFRNTGPGEAQRFGRAVKRDSLSQMIERRGTVYVAPIASYVPSGRMVDPQTSIFYVSWQDWHEETQSGDFEDGGQIAGADEAIAWGRARCDRVLIRLGHTDGTHFSAGHVPL